VLEQFATRWKALSHPCICAADDCGENWVAQPALQFIICHLGCSDHVHIWAAPGDVVHKVAEICLGPGMCLGAIWWTYGADLYAKPMAVSVILHL